MTDQGWVRVEAPSWMWGGSVQGLFAAADMQTRSSGERGWVLARTVESYRRTAPDLVRLIRAAGPGSVSQGLRELSGMSDDDVDAGVRASVSREVQRLGSGGAGDLLEMVSFYQLATGAVSAEDLPEQATVTMNSLKAVTTQGDDAPAFGAAGVYAIRRSDSLLYRTKLMAVLLRVNHDPRVAAGDLAEVQGKDSLAFAAGAELHTGLYLLDPYVGAVLGALTPAVWGFAAVRGRGPIIYSFGRMVAGGSSKAPELIRTLPLQGADRVTEFAELPMEAVPEALTWWASALNSLFAVVSDWAVFADSGNRYSAARHLQVLATVEQLFRRVLSIQASHHDLNARRVLLFTVLDTLEALTGRPIELHCSLEFAESTLASLRAMLPVGSHALLLARAERSVDALRDVQSGFFLREPDGSILSEPSKGRTISPSEAAAQYLKLLRNATHGHGTVRIRQVELTETLLARHDGRVPHDIALLGWLYLLDVLARPEALRSHLAAQTRRSTRH